MTAAFSRVWVQDVEFLVPTEPLPVDMDPADEAPADLDACEHCSGLGVRVVGWDEAERPLDEPCPWCDGSGNRRGWAGAA